jgi:hypothetical protein
MIGVAANPAAPPTVLLRLLESAGQPAWRTLCRERDLSDEVIEAVLAHQERRVRASLARNGHVDPAYCGRLVEDPEPFVRAALAGGPSPHAGPSRPLPDEVIERLLTARDPNGQTPAVTADEIREELVGSGQIPHAFRRAALTHPHPILRAFAAGLWLFLTPAQREPLLADSAPEVQKVVERYRRLLDPEFVEADLPDRDCHYRSMLLVNYAISHAVAERCIAEGRDLWALAGNPHTPYEFIEQLACDPDPKVRARIASRCDLAPNLLAALADDPEGMVRTRALVHEAPRTEPQRQMIDYCIGRSADEIGPSHERFNPPSPDWFATCAVSGHPLLRRIAATYRLLPDDLADRLARDPDDEVRHLLAFNHPLAPSRLLLDAFIVARRQRGYLLTLPNMPRTGLADLLDHEDPAVRALAAADVTLVRPPLAQLTDPDPSVRNAAASNPTIPADVLRRLLEAPESAQAAASNPALAADQLHGLLTRAGVS